MARTGDTDFTTASLIERHDADLANGVGNLVSRTVALINRRRCGTLAAVDPDPTARSLLDAAAALPDRIDRALERFDLRAATGSVIDLARAANRQLQASQPWLLDADDPSFDRILTATLTVCRVLTDELASFVPAGAERLAAQLRTRQAGAAFPQLGGRATVGGCGS